jgi:LPS O-antigen subunit length determinant protein (WzzB/FepE family)
MDQHEIELMDYLKVLWRYKLWIMGVTLFSAFLAYGVSWLLPPVYEVSTVIEPGRYGTDTFETGENRPGGYIYYIDTPQNLEAKITQNSYDHRIREKIKLSPNEKLKWKVSLEKDSYAVKTTLETTKPHQGLIALNELITAISREYSQAQEVFKNTLAQEVKRATEELKILEIRRKELEAESKRIQANTQRLIHQRDTLVANPNRKADPIALLLLTNTLQQNINYYNQILDQVTGVKKDIDNNRSEIIKLKLRQDFIIPIRIIQEPRVSPEPIKPKKILNGAIAGILGLVMSVFGAFFSQYVSICRRK